MKKNLFSICIICFVAIIVFLSFDAKGQTNNQYSEKPIHVFYEGLATMPAFLGMIDMVQLPKEEKKIFAFHRFPKRSDLLDLSEINAEEVPISSKEGYVVISSHPFVQRLEMLLKENPKSPIIIYTNLNNYRYLFDTLFSKVDKKRIKHVHLYEDGLGELFTHNGYFENLSYTQQDVEELKKVYNKEQNAKTPNYAKFMMHHILPVTYHFFEANKAKGMDTYQSFFKHLKGSEIQEINLKKIAEQLSNEQKELLFKLLNFPKAKYEKLFSKGPVFMFFSGYHPPYAHANYHSELNWLKQLMEKYPDFSFMYKPHPSYDAANIKDALVNIFPNVEMIDAQIPYEVFILAGLEPTKIAGFSSSLFYTLNNDQVEGYFPHSSYRKGLAFYGVIDASKQVNPNHFMPNEPLFYDYEIIYKGKKDKLILYNSNIAFIYGAKKAYGYNFIQENLLLVSDEAAVYGKKEGVYVPVQKNVFLMKHSFWQDVLLQKEGDFYCRIKGKKDCGVVAFVEDKLDICWEKWGCETFFKQPDGSYRFQK